MKLIAAMCLILLLIAVPIAEAQQLEVVRPIHFGTIAILKNDTQGNITIDAIGNVNFSDHFLLLDPPEYGIIRLSEFPANANLSVSGIILNSELNTNPQPPERFVFNAINTVPFININSDGTEELRIGGEILTSGSGSLNFADAQYSANLSITFSY